MSERDSPIDDALANAQRLFDQKDFEDVSRPAGSEKTTRHITHVTAGIAPGTRYRLELTAENGAGTNLPLTVGWKTPEEKKK